MDAFTAWMIVALVLLAIGIALMAWALVNPNGKADDYGSLVVFGLGALLMCAGIGTGGVTGLVWFFVRG